MREWNDCVMKASWFEAFHTNLQALPIARSFVTQFLKHQRHDR